MDVEVYISDGQLAGKVVNNIASESMPDKIYIDVNGSKKDIFLLDNSEEYTIKLAGTGDGTMEYSVQDIDVDNWQTIEEKSFTNVTLNNGKRMVSYINSRQNGE